VKKKKQKDFPNTKQIRCDRRIRKSSLVLSFKKEQIFPMISDFQVSMNFSDFIPPARTL
jgi:hypothetical protein